MSPRRPVLALASSTAACLLVGVCAAVVTKPAVREWYPLIAKPSWTPPDAAFGPVWTVLYLLMGVSAWRVWCRAEGAARRRALSLFAVQLLLNGIWSLLFFGYRAPGVAAPELVLLWCAIAATILVFSGISRLAAGLLVPYLIWVSYAMALNVSIWSLNR